MYSVDSLLVDDPDGHEKSYVDFLCKYGACFLVSFCQSPFTKLTLILLIIGDVHRAVRKSNDQ